MNDGKDPNGKVLTEGEKKEYEEAIKGLEPVQAEFKTLIDKTPNFTFDSELTINLGNREVEIKHLGRGNTAGDTIVYLPKEKILVSGDLVVYPVPYMFGGYPSDFIKTLDKLNQLIFKRSFPVTVMFCAGKQEKIISICSADLRKRLYRKSTHR